MKELFHRACVRDVFVTDQRNMENTKRPIRNTKDIKNMKIFQGNNEASCKRITTNE